jgi:hypothetical protein
MSQGRKTQKTPAAKTSNNRGGGNLVRGLSADRTVTITDGDPCPDELYVAAGDVINFCNNDDEDYLIELQRHENMHDPLCLVLPANGTFTIEAEPGNPDDKNVTCTYRILDLNGNPVGSRLDTGGSSGGSVFIGTGSIDAKEKLTVRRLAPK